jgi:hypothetical protein
MVAVQVMVVVGILGNECEKGREEVGRWVVAPPLE